MAWAVWAAAWAVVAHGLAEAAWAAEEEWAAVGGMGGGGGVGGPPQVKATVRWETASPVLQAGKRQWPEGVKGHYLISVEGLPMMGGGWPRGPAPAQQFQEPRPAMDPQQRRRMMAERLKQSTRIERKGKDPIAPAQTEVGQGQGGRLCLLFLFPKTTQPIEAADKDVTLVTQFGPMTVKAKFALKNMMVNGQLEL